MWFFTQEVSQEVSMSGNLVTPDITLDESFPKINQKILANREMTLNIVNIWSES